MKKFIAFTLAEVLITISILGVIAALTIPNLYLQKKRREYSARLQHFYSKMENAIEQSAMELPLKYCSCPIYDAVSSSAGNRTNAMLDWYMEYVDPYMGHTVVKTVEGPYSYRWSTYDGISNVASAPFHHKVYFDDGSMLVLIPSGCSDGAPQWFYDLTGDAGPNLVGVDIFLFQFVFSKAGRIKRFGNENVYFGPYITSSATNPAGNSVYSRDLIKAKCNINNSADYGFYCMRLLQIDGWEFKPDYPLKL